MEWNLKLRPAVIKSVEVAFLTSADLFQYASREGQQKKILSRFFSSLLHSEAGTWRMEHERLLGWLRRPQMNRAAE